MRPLLPILTLAIVALSGCREGSPKGGALDLANNRLSNGAVSDEVDAALGDAIRVDPRRLAGTARGSARTAAQDGAGLNCIERYRDRLVTSDAWATKLPPGFALPAGARVDEAAGRDGGACAIRVVSLAVPGSDRERVASFYEQSARVAGYDAGRTTRGGDLVVGGTRGDAAWLAMIGAPRGGVVPVDYVWSSGG